MFDIKQNRAPAGSAWVWLTAEMMKSDAWRSLGINERRFVDFVLIEFLQHGGTKNGLIKAPYEQLEKIGISGRLIAKAIDRVEEVGLIDAHRGGKRVATTYTLNWLPTHDGRPSSNRWRDFRSATVRPWPEPEKPHASR